MSFDSHWRNVVAKHPHLGDETAMTKLRVASLKDLMRQAYQIGEEAGRGKDADGKSFEKLFGGLFR